MVHFDYEKAPKEWFCQGHTGCILFALINSGNIRNWSFDWLPSNEDYKTKSTEEKLRYELKTMAIWAAITGYYPFEHKETFHTIYGSFIKLVKKQKPKLDKETYNKKLTRIKNKIRELQDFYADHDGKSLNDGTWDCGPHLKLETQDFTSLEDLPCNAIIGIEKHWVVYIGEKDGFAIVIDSRNPEGYVRIPEKELKGSKVILPKNIHIAQETISWIVDDFDLDSKETLRLLRRREFSPKMGYLIARLDQICFTQKDYNKFVKQSKSLLEKLDKEHYRYERRT